MFVSEDTGLPNRAAFKKDLDVEHKAGHAKVFCYIAVHGLQRGKDLSRITYTEAENVICTYAQHMSTAACRLQNGEPVDGKVNQAEVAAASRSMRKCTAYHLGGDRFALMCVKKDDVTVESFQGELELLATHLASLEESVVQAGSSGECLLPTLLRIGVATSLVEAERLEMLVRSNADIRKCVSKLVHVCKCAS